MPNMNVYKKPKGAQLFWMGFRLTLGQKEAVQKAAAEVGLCPTDWIRIAVFKELAK